jgi:hypothetical protein
MNIETASMVRIASAISRLQAWDDGDWDELPDGYTHESLQYRVDMRLVTDFARGVLGLLAGR